MLPGHDIGVMLKMSNHDLITWAYMFFTPSSGDQVDGFGGTAHKYNVIHRRCVEEPAYGFACAFVGIGSTCSQLVCGAVNVGILVLIKVGDAVNDALRLLCCGCIVEPDQRMAMYALIQDREIL